MNCKNCNGKEIKEIDKKGIRTQYFCKNCERVFTIKGEKNESKNG